MRVRGVEKERELLGIQTEYQAKLEIQSGGGLKRVKQKNPGDHPRHRFNITKL